MAISECRKDNLLLRPVLGGMLPQTFHSAGLARTSLPLLASSVCRQTGGNLPTRRSHLLTEGGGCGPGLQLERVVEG